MQSANCMQDLRLAYRALIATPLVTLVAVLSLALGIGANVAIFSLANSLLLRPLPIASPDRLVAISDTSTTDVQYWMTPVWDDLRQRTDLFDTMCAFAWARLQHSENGQTQALTGS